MKQNEKKKTKSIKWAKKYLQFSYAEQCSVTTEDFCGQQVCNQKIAHCTKNFIAMYVYVNND